MYLDGWVLGDVQRERRVSFAWGFQAEKVCMTEMDSDAPKRTPRPRRRKVPPTEQVESGELLETGMAEAQPLKPVIEDVLEEIAA